MLRVSNRNNNINTNTCKRKALTEITNNITSPSENRGSSNNENDLHIITPPIVPERIVTTDLVVDYFLSKDAKTLFKHAVLNSIIHVLRFLQVEKLEPQFIQRYCADIVTSPAV